MPPVLPHISWSSDRTLRIEFGGAIDAVTRARVHGALGTLRAAHIDALVDLTPAYATLAATFDPARLDHAAAERDVRASLERASADATGVTAPAARTIDIPVDYGGLHGPDLAFVAEHARLGQRAAVELHASVLYTVCFLGFAPGFAYLSGLPEALATPRLATPRARIPVSSVAIGGGQTAVYPGNTPGGWRLIGRARVSMFDAGRAEPALLGPGDRVRFVVASFAPAAESAS